MQPFIYHAGWPIGSAGSPDYVRTRHVEAPRVKWSTTVGGHPSHFHSQADICVSSVVGLLDAQGRDRLEKVLNKAVREGFLPKRHPSFAQICDSADEQMFGDILKNPKQVLHHLLPPVSEAKSRLRTRAHDREMPAANQNTFTRKNVH